MTDLIQWQRDNPAGSATGATDISGATGSSYTYTISDVGHKVRARDSGDATVAVSPWSAVVTNPAPPPPGGEIPIGVWLQSANNATAYHNIGINRYIGFLDGTTAGFNSLKAAGIKAFVDSAHQSAALAYSDQTVIAGWLQPDEPDNCQFSCPVGANYPCCCMTPAAVLANYNAFKAADPQDRPVIVNLGRALGNPAAPDRGQFYIDQHYTPASFYAACDIASNDVYPVNNGNGSNGANGPLTEVADAVDRMIQYAPGKPHYQIIECTRISPTEGKPTPAQTKCEAWLAMIHGATGIVYFCHVIDPFVEAGLLADSAMSASVGAVNAQIQQLSGVLQTASVTGTTVQAANRIDHVTKVYSGKRYVFATGPLNATTAATFTVSGGGSGLVTVIGESRTVQLTNGVFSDSFAPYAVHLYQLPT